jgi:ADP-ribosylglycohydrolase
MEKRPPTILGAIAGDVIGSVYEWKNVRSTDFPLFTDRTDFTDDTVLTIAVADAILNEKEFGRTIWEYGRMHRNRGYGGMFIRWLQERNPRPYGSYGNGSAMRVSPVGFACTTMEKVLEMAKWSAEVTHNHPEGIKGAQATAAAVFMARNNSPKKDIRDFLATRFGYDLDFTLESIRPHYEFNVTCQGSVPQAIVAFLESSDFEDAVRLAISIGGDSDTIACIAGGVATAYYKHIPEEITEPVLDRLPPEFIDLIEQFDEAYSSP